MNRARGAMRRGIPGDTRLLDDRINGRGKRLALLHGSVQRLP